MPISTSEHRRRALRRARTFALANPAKAVAGAKAARKIGDGKIEAGQPADAAWQARAYDLVDAVGELGYVSHLTANTAKDGLLRVGATRDDDELDTRLEERAAEILSWFVGPDGDQAELVRMATFHLSVGGETILLGTSQPAGGADEAITWEFLSTTEVLLRKGRKPQRIVDGARVDLPADAYWQRLHRPRPSHSQLADSPVRRLLPIAEEIHLLDRIIRNSVRGRLNAGGLYVPDELSWSEDDETDGGFDEQADGLDEFTEELIAHITSPIEDHDNLASQIPLLVKGPAEFHDAIHHFDLGPNAADWAVPMRADALDRLIRSMDAPPEIVEGKGGLNHWTGASVDFDYIEKYVAPPAGMVARFITVAYLRPMLVASGLSDEIAARVEVKFDTTPLTQRADDAAAARLLFPMGLVSEETVVRASGFRAEDVPDDTEKLRRLILELVGKAPVTMGPVLLPMLPEFADVNFPERGGSGEGGGDGGAPEPGGDSQKEAPQEQPAQPEPAAPDANSITSRVDLAVQVTAWADVALERAFERAEARLRSRLQGHDDLKARYAKAPRGGLLAAVSGEDLAGLGTGKVDLLDGAFDTVADRVAAATGEPAVADRVRRLLTAHAAAHFGTLPAAGTSIEGRVPRSLIERVLV